MITPKRYYCGNGEGMFQSKNGQSLVYIIYTVYIYIIIKQQTK